VLSNLLFDLDGTLTDPKEGITKSIQYALTQLGRPVPSSHELEWTIGPPLQGSFPRLLGSGEPTLSAQALSLYRERYRRTGMFENEMYDGVADVLAALCDRGYTLFVATTKPGVFAREIVAHFGLSGFFRAVHGSELNGERVDKTDLIAFILEQESLDASETLMIGDRAHDVIGARRNGVRAGGVLYGYGTREELLDSGAEVLFDSPRDMIAFFDTVA